MIQYDKMDSIHKNIVKYSITSYIQIFHTQTHIHQEQKSEKLKK